MFRASLCSLCAHGPAAVDSDGGVGLAKSSFLISQPQTSHPAIYAPEP